MNEIYEIIQRNPELYAWAFGLINVAWGIFLYFNRKRHDRELESLRHSLRLDFTRRKHTYEIRAAQYGSYAKMLDDFGRSFQSQALERMQPTFTKYLSAMISARNDGEKGQAAAAFSSEVMDLMSEASEGYLQIQAETKSLKLTASDELIVLLDDMEQLMKESMEGANELMAALPGQVVAGQTDVLMRDQEALTQHATRIVEKSKQIERQMRDDLENI